MFTNTVVGLKPGVENELLLDLATSVTADGGDIHLATLVKVATDDDEPDRLRAIEARLEEARAPLVARGYQVTTEAHLFVHGAGPQLVRVAEERAADLLVIGMSRRSRVGKALMGSDAQSVLLQAGCPVLVARIDR